MISIVKRNGEKQAFDANKIVKAIEAAFNDVEHEVSKSAHQLAVSIATIISQIPDTLTVEQIQDRVEDLLMSSHRKDVAKAYIHWRYGRSLIRRENTTDKTLMELLDGKNSYWNDENGNKNARVVHTQRDYIAGATSTDLTRRLLLTPDIVKAHDEGIIHFHDADYFAQNVLHNCCLINLEDMLQNGTCINGVWIDKPHRLITATTIATQIITAVSSSQYGGATVTLSHLAPFVEESRKRYRARFEKIISNKEELDKLVFEATEREIVDSVQTFCYQINSMATTNGQAPFLSVCMYLNEVNEGQTKIDLARLIEEFLKQRIQGLKNDKGVFITPAFPKLLYFLEEDNIRPGTRFWYLTELAARCTAKRMVPDYISEKMMIKLKKGDSYPCMGAVEPSSVIEWKLINSSEEELCKSSFEDFWLRITSLTPAEVQPGRSLDLYIDCEKAEHELFIKDTVNKWVKVKKLTRILNTKWIQIRTAGGKELTCTYDHPLPVANKEFTYESPNGKYRYNGWKRVEAEQLHVDDCIKTAERVVDRIIMVEHLDRQTFAYDVETESDTFEVNGIWSCNCRSFLTPDRTTQNYAKAKNYDESSVGHKYYGRFNQGVVTINLVDVALSAKREYGQQIDDDDMRGDLPSGNESLDSIFWRIFDKRLELCHKALRMRHDRLCGGVADMAPILWRYGALARLDKGESIKELLYHGYSTISLGYAGLYECVKAITGESQSGVNGKKFGLQVMQHMNDCANKWKAAEDIDYSVYGTPIESTTYKFALALKRRFGNDVFTKLDGVDRNYITNSYHIPVFEEIDPFNKLALESEFQALSPGGAISYIECADLTKNIEAVLQVIQFIYDNIMYAELNFKSCLCKKCMFEGELKIVDQDNKLQWKCPNCGCMDQNELFSVFRLCGYLSSGNAVNQGRLNDVRDRYIHLDNHEAK